jgi:hypothetical protein
MPVIPATQKAELRRIEVQSQPQANSPWDPISKIPIIKKDLCNGSSGKAPASNCEALSSNTSTAKKRKIKKRIVSWSSAEEQRQHSGESHSINNAGTQGESESSPLQNNSKWFMDLNVKSKTMKLPEDNTEKISWAWRWHLLIYYLGLEVRASHLLGRNSTTWATAPIFLL